MAVTGVTETSSSTDMSQVAQIDSEMGKEEFLELLVTQLQYQDPLNPMDNEAFVAQLAQFSSLEQMQNMNSSFEQLLSTQQLAQLSDLIDMQVKLFDSETGLVAVDEVVGVYMEGGNPQLLLKSGAIAEMSDVVEFQRKEEVEEEVEEEEEETEEETASTNNTTNATNTTDQTDTTSNTDNTATDPQNNQTVVSNDGSGSSADNSGDGTGSAGADGGSTDNDVDSTDGGTA